MPAGRITLTVTAKTGPGGAVTSLVVPQVNSVNFRFKDGAVDVYSEDPPRMQTFQYSDLVTVTMNPAARTLLLSTS